MNRTNDSKSMTVCALLTIPWLARASGLTRNRIARVLEHNGVRIRRSGRVRFVTLADLKEGFPELWESLLDVEIIRGRG